MDGAIFIVGPAKSGKSTFAKLLAKEMGWGEEVIGETGEHLMGELASHLAILLPFFGRPESYLASMQEEKDKWRPRLVYFGDHMTGMSPGILWGACLAKGARIVCGVRRKSEVSARMSYATSKNDVWILIERPGFVSPPDVFELAGLQTVLEQWVRTGFTVNNVGEDSLRESAKSIAAAIQNRRA